jgi:hypothetical protein
MRHKKCILGWTNNCCTKISGDHFVSAAVLRVLNEKRIRVSTSTFTREHALNSSALKVNRLCRRHNSALSPIDSEAARLFSSFAQIHTNLHQSLDGQKLYFFHGTDIERWLLKTMLMVYYSKQTNVTPANFQMPARASSIFRHDLGRPLGLYLPTKTRGAGIESFRTESAASALLVTNGSVVCGITVTLGGLLLTLMIDGHESDFVSLAETHTYRPKHLLFFKGNEVYCIGFAFPDGSTDQIWFSHGEPDASIPVN